MSEIIRVKDAIQSALEDVIDFNVRDRGGAAPQDYLKNFLRVSREFGYATEDGSWGELEKELTVAFRNLVEYERALAFMADAVAGDGAVEAAREWLLLQGEMHHQEKKNDQSRKRRLSDRIFKPLERLDPNL